MSIQEIQAEREAQKTKWSSAKDDQWTPGEWAALVSHYATRTVFSDLRGINLEAFRADMVKVGALALAAVEAIDRKVP